MKKLLMTMLLCGTSAVIGCTGGGPSSPKVSAEEAKKSAQEKSEQMAKDNATKMKNYKPGRPGSGGPPGGHSAK